MKRIVLGLALASAMLATASCCSVPELSGKWNILTVNGEEATVIGEEKPFMEFNTEDSRIHGFTGCNIMNGAYTQDGKNLTFTTGGVDGCDCAEILRLIAEGRIDTTPLITHRFPLSGIEEAYRIFENRLDGVIKVAVTC